VPTQSLSNLSGNNSQLGSPSLRKHVNPRTGTSANVAVKAEDEEVYSDPDDGVEIVDMENVRQMDWMAPESLRKDRQTTKKVEQEPVDAIGAVFLLVLSLTVGLKLYR
jgi:DNA-directed RNA polymerase III subunit RPC4